MKKLYALVSAIFLYFISINCTAQVSTNGGSGLLPAYGSLSGAIADLNAATISSNVVITLEGNETAPAGGYVITATGTAGISIVIDGAGYTVKAAPATAGNTNDAVFKIVGGDYFTIQNFIIQENTANTVTATAASNTMTEFGIALYGSSAANGAQNNTIQNNTISLNNAYAWSFGIMSTCTFSSAATAGGAFPAALSATAGGENSNNKYYSNTINNVSFGIMIVAPTTTATIRQTGDDIGGASAATGNNITYGTSVAPAFTIAYPQCKFASVDLGGIILTNITAANVRFNTVSTIDGLAIATTGIILGWTTAAPSGYNYTNAVSNNTITINTSSNAGNAYGIDFGYGLNAGGFTGTLTASNNTVTINQTTTVSTAIPVQGIRTPYNTFAVNVTGNVVNINQTHAAAVTLQSPAMGINVISGNTAIAIPTITVTGNNITFTRIQQSTGTYTSLVYGINLSVTTPGTINVTTANINFNNVTIKESVTGAGSFGNAVIHFIYVSGVSAANLANFTTLNINSNNLNTLGSTIRGTPANVIGVNHDFTNVNSLSIASNIISIDRTGAGPIYGTFTNTTAYTISAASATSNILKNNITISGSMAGSIPVVGHNELEGLSSMVKNINEDTVNITLPSVNGSTQSGINYQMGGGAAGASNNIGSIASCIVTIATGGQNINGILVSGGTGTGIITNINNNAFNLSSSNTTAAISIAGVNVTGGNGSRIYSNNFNSMAAPNAATNTPTIRAILLQPSSSIANIYEIYQNTISNIFTFAGTGGAVVEGIGVSATVTFANIYKNKIHGLTASSSGTGTLVTGIRINPPQTAGGILNINNNYIGFDNSTNPNTSSADAVRGLAFVSVNAACSLNVYHNTIYLTATPSATSALFGTTGIYHTFSTTAGVATLTLRNNIIVNNSSNKAHGKTVAFRRNVGTNMNNYGSASNNNLFYAGTPGLKNFIFFTTDSVSSFAADQTLTAFKARVAARDNASVTENPPFLSTLGTDATYLHINPAVGTVVESGGGTGTGITDDYDGQTRCPGGGCPGGYSVPDIGADELAGTCPVPAAPTNLILTVTYSGSFTAAVPPPTGGYFIVRTANPSPAPVPVLGTDYTPSIGTPVAMGPATATPIAYTTTTNFTNPVGAGAYIYWVFSYNVGCGTFPNYSITTANATTAACIAPGPATTLNLTPVSSSNITGTFTGSGASGYLVVRTTSAAAPGTPAGFYNAGDVMGTGIVVSSGTSTSFSATGLSGSTSYWFWVFAYNDGCFGAPAYAASVSNTTTTQPCLVPGTYSVGPTGNFASIGDVMTALACFTFTPNIPTTGAYIFEFQPTYNSNVETFPVVMAPVNGTSATFTITFRPQAGATGRSISSSNPAGTLLFQGVSATQRPNYYIFDGRPGGIGTAKELTIQNTNLGSSYAIQFENGANNITIQYCKITSVHNGTSGGGGTITFASTSTGNGNNNNTITNNDIFQAPVGSATPTSAIYSNGLSTAANNSNIISNNNIYNFFNATYNTAGINLAANSTSWTISDNSFYQTLGRTFTSATATFSAILSASNTVGGLTITNNFIGGTAPLAASGILSIGGNGILKAIQLTTSTTATSVQNNTIKSIAFTSSSSSAAQSLINLAAGVINVGTTTGNTLGAITGTNNITITLSDNTAGVNFAAISGASTAATDVFAISNNKIGSIGILGTSTSANIQGINISGATGTYTVAANTIGSTATANSFANSLNTTLTGIYGNSSNATPTQLIFGNTIANLSATNAGTNSYVTGISVNNLGRYNIGNAANGGNTIYNLSSAGTNTANYNATGIANFATTAGQIIYGNTIYNVNSTAGSSDVGVIGIYYSGPAGAASLIESNNIHSLNMVSNNTSSVITGIQIQSGTANYYNNMIRLGITVAGANISIGYGIYGITENAGSNNIWMNSVYIGGTGVASGSDSYAFFGANTTQNVQNNIFWNARANTSATTPNHYAIVLNTTTGSIDYNDILVTGTGKVLGYFSGQYLTLATWRTATSRDINSYSALPGFINPTAGTPDLHITPGVVTVVEGGGNGAGPTNDIDALARAGYTPIDLGADAVNAAAAPVTVIKIDGSITALTAPAPGFACFSSTETISGTFRTVSAINFAATPVTITINVTGAATATFTATITTGSFAAGTNIPFTAAGTLNMTTPGTYTFTCNFTVGSGGSDRDMTNDEFITTRINSPLSVGTVTSNPVNFCGVASGTPTLSLNSVSGGTIQWFQSAVSLPAGDPGWGAPVGTNSTTYTPASPITSTRYYYAKVSCGPSSVNSNVVTVNIDNPVLISAAGTASSCGPNTFTFTGSVNAGSILRWYDASTGALAGTGSPFTTPLLSSTTTYNARAESTSGVPASATFGTGTSTNTTTGYPAPYTNWYGGTKHQMLILGTELAAAGITSGNINSVAFSIASVGSSFTGSLTDFTIHMGSTSSTALTTTFLPVAPTPVYGPVNQAIPSSGQVVHTFSTPFNWDGVSNIIIQTSYSNGNLGGTNDNVQMYYTPTSFASTGYYRADNATSAAILASPVTGGIFGTIDPTVNRPNMVIGYTAVCSSPSSAVTATVNPAPTPIDINTTTRTITLGTTAPSVGICTDSAKLVVTGGTTTQNNSVTVSSGAISLAIPDYSGAPSNVNHTLPVFLPNGATIDSVRIRVNIIHSWDADLNINLQANGSVVNLVNREGGSGDNFNNTQISSNTSNASLGSAAAPFGGLYKADLATTATTAPATNTNTFSSLFAPGTGANQNWTLWLHDMAGADIGTLQNWSITVFYKEPIPVPYLWTSSTGLYTNSVLSSPYTNQNIGTVFAKPTVTTTYTVTATLGICSKTDTVQIVVNDLSAAATAVNITPSTGCSGSNFTLTQTGGALGTGASWKWYTDMTFTTPAVGVGSSTAPDASFVVTPLVTTTYYLRAEGGAAPCAGTVPSTASVTATINPVNTWLGVNTDWNDALNWCPGIPTSATNVTIPTSANYPNITGTPALCNNITITGSGTVTVAAGGTLRIAGSITNTGDSIDATAGTIEFNGSVAQTLRANHFKLNTIANLTISNTNAGGVTIDNTGLMLNISGTTGFGNVNNAVLNTSDKLTLLSTAAATARIGDVTNNAANTGNNINGKVVVERYIPPRRAWRLITSPIRAATLPVANIFNQWQEGAQSTTLGMLADPKPGYGTHISRGMPFMGSYDQNNTGNPSIYYLTTTGWNGTLSTTNGTVAGTNTGVITDQPAYMVFIRGNRSTNLGLGIAAPLTSTILRNTGLINVTPNDGAPTVVAGVGAYVAGVNTYNVWSNPYPSSISYHSLVTSAGNNGIVPDALYVWDANITGTQGVGGWVSMIWNSGTSLYDKTVVSGPGSSLIDNTGYIQSGSAFMVRYTGNISFREKNKISGSSNLVFRPAGSNINQLRTNLLAKNADGTVSVNDGILVTFNKTNNNGVDDNDMPKMQTFAEYLGIKTTTATLAIERRKPVSENDTIQLWVARLKEREYQLEFALEGMTNDSPGIVAELEDNFTKNRTVLSLADTTRYNFAITSNTASSDINRFRIVFKKLIQYTGINASIRDEDVVVNWKVAAEFNIHHYEIERSTDGSSFVAAGSKPSAGDFDEAKLYSWLDIRPEPGVYYYRIKCVGKNGVTLYSDVAKVTVVKSAPAMFVFPNPVPGNTIQLQMNKMPGGVYDAVIMSDDGKAVSRSRISHIGGTATELINPGHVLPNGSYKIEITGPDRRKTILKIVVQKQ